MDGKRINMYELKKNDAITILKARLNMLNIKDNFHGKYKDNNCDLCNSEEDSTEHLFECEGLKSLREAELSVKSLENPPKELARYIREGMKIKHLAAEEVLNAKASSITPSE